MSNELTNKNITDGNLLEIFNHARGSCTLHLKSSVKFTNNERKYINTLFRGKKYHFCCSGNGVMADVYDNGEPTDMKEMNDDITTDDVK